MGWGEQEMGPYNYWGGWFDLVGELEKRDILFWLLVSTCFFKLGSRYWLYYQLKGGQIDYGKYHSEIWLNSKAFRKI